MPDLFEERIVLGRHATTTGEIQLQQRRLANGQPAFEIIVDGMFLMASYNQASERALARLALDGLTGSGWRLLVGGLGMGFTLQAALLDNRVAVVEVVELEPHVIEWNRSYFAPLNRQALLDPRLELRQEDIGALLYDSPLRPERYEAILLDVDNGPSWLAHEHNARLYTAEALARWAAMLRPGGHLAVWSAQPEPGFLARLQAAFGRAAEIAITTAGSRQEPVEHFIYRAQKPVVIGHNRRQ